MPVDAVLFKDEAGNNLAEVRWSFDQEAWVARCARCDDDVTMSWRYMDLILSDAVSVAASHLGHHAMTGVMA